MYHRKFLILELTIQRKRWHPYVDIGLLVLPPIQGSHRLIFLQEFILESANGAVAHWILHDVKHRRSTTKNCTTLITNKLNWETQLKNCHKTISPRNLPLQNMNSGDYNIRAMKGKARSESKQQLLLFLSVKKTGGRRDSWTKQKNARNKQNGHAKRVTAEEQISFNQCFRPRCYFENCV